VTRLRVHLKPPNPTYEGRPDVERLIEDARLVTATLDLRSDDINTDADLIGQALDHVQRGYGDGSASGVRGTGDTEIETVYNTDMEGETEVVERPADPETGEVSQETLQEELSDRLSN
jgi:hypothetical protein